MPIHIGNIIRNELRRQGNTNEWLADRIGVTERTLQRLFNKSSIDSSQLLTLCRVLNFDFFQFYSEELKKHNSIFPNNHDKY